MDISVVETILGLLGFSVFGALKWVRQKRVERRSLRRLQAATTASATRAALIQAGRHTQALQALYPSADLGAAGLVPYSFSTATSTIQTSIVGRSDELRLLRALPSVPDGLFTYGNYMEACAVLRQRTQSLGAAQLMLIR